MKRGVLGLSLDKPSLEHSTFSRFHGRLSKETMLKLNHEALQAYASKGLTINEGIDSVQEGDPPRRAVDA